MANTSEEKAAAKVIYDIGNQLAQHLDKQSRVNKDIIVKSLRKAEDAFPVLRQSPSLKPAIEPLSKSLIRHSLLQHKDKDVRVLVASCLCQIIRVLAPDPPYDDEILRDIFKLIISMFAELSDTKSPYFTRRVKILETVARLKCCLLMVDIGCDDLVLEMFNIFFSVASEHHQQSLRQSMLSIMALILEEKVTQPLLDVILHNLLKEEKGASPASFWLAVSIIQDCAEKLEPFVRGFLTSSILDKDSVENELKEYYHEIIIEIFQCAPQMLLAVLPSLSHELLTDQVDVRIKAVNLLGRLFALPGSHVVQEYRQLFVEFLKRFSDKSAEVRISSLKCVKAFYSAISSGSETLEVLAALEGRLLDFDDKVRTQAVITICDLGISNLRCISSELILRAMERLRDKKVSVRKTTMQKLLELYREYCTQCSEGVISFGDPFEQIPCKIMMLCYDKDCKDFRPQNMDLVLAEDLFPASLSVEERMRHWIFLFSVFTPAHVKAFHSILSQKWRLQTEMNIFLELRKEDKGNTSDEVQKKIRSSCKKMSASFVDPSKAEECFQKLQQMKDGDLFNKLWLLLNEKTSLSDGSVELFRKPTDTRVELLKRVEDKHPLYEFLKILSLKCSFNIFGSDDVHYILSDLSGNNVGTKYSEASAISLLLNVVCISPSLLRGSEGELRMLVCEKENPFLEKLLQILVKASRYVSIKLDDIYPALERACLEGTRSQSKFAISAIAALGGVSDEMAFSTLYENLVDSLHARKNISTVLQSLGCIAQYSVSIYGSREREIKRIIQAIFHEKEVELSEDLALPNENSGCSISCRVKIYGLKTLVKSFLPYQATHVRPQMKELLNILSKILAEGKFSDGADSSENDEAHIRLAAAKSVLRLARRWDLHVTPQIFHLVILKARDPSSLVRRFFLDKIYKLLKEHAIPSRYACAFALAASDDIKDVQASSLKYLEEFIREYSKAARIRQTSAKKDQGETVTSYPGYTVVFLVHVLAHDPSFPSENCQDKEIYARFCSPLVATLQALVSASCADGSKNGVSDTLLYMLNIFRAILKAEDAINGHKTSKLHILADIGVLLVKKLSPNGTPSYLPGLMLLPSTFYKVTLNTRCDEEKQTFHRECPFDEDSIEKVLRFFQSNIIGTASSLTKQSGKVQKDSLLLDGLKHAVTNFPAHKEPDKLASRVERGKEKSYLQRMNSQTSTRQDSTRGKSKPLPSNDGDGDGDDDGKEEEDDDGLLGMIQRKISTRGKKKQLPSNSDGGDELSADFLSHKESDKLASRMEEENENSSLQRMKSEISTRQVNTRGKNKHLPSNSDDDGLLGIIKRRVSTRGKKKPLPSNDDDDDDDDDDGLLGIIQRKKGVNGSTKLNLRRHENSSSCGSVVTRPSYSESQVSIEEEDALHCREKNKKKKNQSASETCELSKCSLKSHINTKGSRDSGEKLIGQRIKLWSPIDKCFYSGSIDGFDSQNSSHKVSYDNGEVELLRLTNEKWEIICKDSSPKEAKKINSMLSDSGMDSSISSISGINTRGSKASKQVVTTNKRITHLDNEKDPSVAGKRKKQHLDVAVDEMAIARRTRSRKV